MAVENLDVRSLQLAILKSLSSVRNQYKFNLLGKSNAKGDLERQLGVEFELDQRHSAALAFTALEKAGLIRPTYNDLISPDLWFAITDQGRTALERGSTDASYDLLRGSSNPEKELEQKFKILFSAAQAGSQCRS